MRLHPYTLGAMGLALALALSTPSAATAQIDTTRRDTSDMRIRVRKDQVGMRSDTVIRRESGGEVLTREMVRLDSLEAAAAMYRQRIDSLEAANAAMGTRTAALEARITALSDSLSATRSEIAALREELASTNTRLTEVDTRLQNLNQRFDNFRNRSLFGNSGFYVGAGTGANFTTGTLDDLGYGNALNVTVPIGWHKPGSMLGIRTEWSMHQLEGVQTGSFVNPDPTVLSGVAMVTLAFPLNDRNNAYLMGGGGFYQFRDFGSRSALASRFSSSQDDPDSETKWGFNVGAGLEFHVLGATSLFLQSSVTNVAADEPPVGAAVPGRNLRWIPLVVGVMLR
jgi:opacity protein-like surface antigen